MRHIVQVHGTFEHQEDVQGLEEELLVEEYAEGYGRVCRQLFYLSIGEGRYL